MSSRALWALSIPLALVGWIGLFYFTGGVQPTGLALLGFVPLFLLALTMTLAPWVWAVAHRLGVPGLGERPALALRASFWVGLWSAMAVSLRLLQAFNWVIVITVAVVLVLLEGFLQQWRVE